MRAIPSLSRRFPIGKFGGLVAIVALGMAGFVSPAAHGEAEPRAGEFLRTESEPTKKSEESGTGAVLPTPARPAGRVFDDARVFSPEERTALEAILANTAKNHGLDVYVAATTFVIGESLEERAQRLCDAWVDQNRGLLFLYLRGEQKMTMCAPQSGEPFLPKAVLFRHYEEAARAGLSSERPAERIGTTVTTILGSLREATARSDEMAKVFDPDVRRVIAFFTAALVLLAGAGLLLARVLAAIDRSRDTRLVFPTSRVSPRFGAPYGGGVCSEITYARRD